MFPNKYQSHAYQSNKLISREPAVVDYLHESRCKCGHLYDFYNTGARPKEKYFHQATRHGSYWFDKAKIYQLDPMEDFIKDTFEEAMRSRDLTVRYLINIYINIFLTVPIYLVC